VKKSNINIFNKHRSIPLLLEFRSNYKIMKSLPMLF